MRVVSRITAPVEWLLDKVTETDARTDFYTMTVAAFLAGWGVTSYDGLFGAFWIAFLVALVVAARLLYYRSRLESIESRTVARLAESLNREGYIVVKAAGTAEVIDVDPEEGDTA